ncbi:synaptopodin-2-like [Oncorhynchus keta]|uniref:synaptopodin-2-like n=1 Tax=Oncorhynchus keta TaxID=8018 RepID=UPI0015FB34A1|nr:synaptopodin-2-like [Oncorhynchus keta]
MEPETEDQESTVMDSWSVSEYGHSSDDLYISESRDGSYYEERKSDTEVPIDPQHTHIRQAESPHSVESPEPYTKKAMVEHQRPPSNYSPEERSLVRGLSPSRSQEIDTLSQGPCSVYPGESLSSDAESYPSTPSPIPPKSPQAPTPNPNLCQMSRQRSSSSSSVGRSEMTLTLTHGQPRGDGRRLGSGTGARGNGSVESLEEGGHSEAPPAHLSFGISAQGAEQAEQWNSASERDLPSPSRHRVRRARPRQSESQSDRQVKEAKSKCKRIALLLTNAPNSRNRGVLMFKKRRQRVKKYTLVSYGTGQHQFDDQSGKDEESEYGKTVRFALATNDYLELDEDYTVNVRDRDVNLNWENLGIANIFHHLEEMEQLPETKGKGVAMFVQRRQRMDEIALEHEEMRRKGLPVKGIVELEDTEMYKSYKTDETYVQSNQIQYSERHADQIYMDGHGNQHLQYKENQQEMQQYAHMMNSMPNLLASAIPKPLVPNRTAKPFLGSQNRVPVPFSPLSGVTSPVKHHELKFKVSVPIHTVPQVWSPTGDFIASRDERISVPAIKTGILPDSKRRGANRAASDQPSNAYIQNRGERRSYIESGEEEDYFSLGAEACNFMQPRTVKHKNPPPVAPKPSINPVCPPWLKESPSNVLLHLARSPIPASFPNPVGSSPQQYFKQQDWLSPQQTANPREPPQTQSRPQPPMNTGAPANSTSPSQLHPTMNSWSPQPPWSPVSIQAPNPTHTAPRQPTVSKNKSPNPSVASCPPQRGSSYSHAAMAPPTSSMGHISEGHVSPAINGPTLRGRGAELFAKRQTRMEKFVVDAETVQANKAKCPSPTASLPGAWRYSSNIRAPPPLSYNPLHAPFYPPAAAKQPYSTSPKIKPKTTVKTKPQPSKHLDALDVMKHQPYQLDSSLFRYNVGTEAEGLRPSLKTAPNPTLSPKPAPVVSPRPAFTISPYSYPGHDLPPAKQQSKPIAPAKSTRSGLGRSYSLSLPRRMCSMSYMPSQSSMSPVTTPVFHPSLGRQTSWQDKAALKPPSPWEAASRSPLGLVDDAFRFQNFPQSIATNVNSAANRRSLPEPPDEWKRKVSLDAPSVSGGYYRAPPPAMHTRSISMTSAPVYGPPFRQAQPLWSAVSASAGHMGRGPGHPSQSLYATLPRTAMRR